MPAERGQSLSHYRLVEKIGEGGMGVVWKAEDTVLGRQVAVKVLPEVFAQDPDRRARLEREAKLLANLNHPNIAAIFGLEESGGVRFLVMELVPGETLAERLAGGSLPDGEALSFCRQIAEAVEAAHDKGIIHRDLKPANVKVTPEGKVKVLDFGLAKAFEVESSGSTDSSRSQSPTMTSAGTREGVIQGSAAYMSPEQARGKPVDRRTDIWAFGCVLFETLTGRRAFDGETVSDAIARILEREPDWNLLPGDTRPGIRRLLRRCLRKNQYNRLHDIADARIEIDEALAEPAAVEAVGAVPAHVRQGWQTTLPWILAVTLAVVAAVAIWSSRGTDLSPRPMSRFTIDLPAGQRLGVNLPVVFSPDGSLLVFVGERGSNQPIYLRPRDSLEARPLPGTEGAEIPFFSPDAVTEAQVFSPRFGNG